MKCIYCGKETANETKCDRCFAALPTPKNTKVNEKKEDK